MRLAGRRRPAGGRRPRHRLGRGRRPAREPALQRPRAGHLPLGDGGPAGVLEQAQAEEAGPPAGVLLPQGESDGEQGMSFGGLAGSGPVVGLESIGLLAQAAQEVADGACLQPESGGDGGGRLSASAAGDDLPPQG